MRLDLASTIPRLAWTITICTVLEVKEGKDRIEEMAMIHTNEN